MDTFTVEKTLYKLLGTDIFIGAFPAGNLPTVTDSSGSEYPFCLVANTDVASKAGDHWVALYFDAKGEGHYFDSIGRAPPYRDWVNYMQAHSRHGVWDWCRADIQPLDSPLCGQFCITYLLKRHNTPLHVLDYTLMCDENKYSVQYLMHKLKLR